MIKEIEGRGYTIYQGDCLDVLPRLGAGSVDATICDPPYGVDMAYNSYVDSIESTQELLLSFIKESERIAKITLTTVGRFANEIFLYQNKPPRWRICWRKGITSRPSPIGFTDWEPIFVYGNQVHRNSHDLFTVQPELMGAHGHPCPKPLAWAQWLIARFSDPGDLICDPFMGSGTTGVAALQLGRKFIGVELDPGYFEIAHRRIEDAARMMAGQPKLLTGRSGDTNGLPLLAELLGDAV